MPTVHITYGGPTPTDPFWELSAVVADVKIGQAIQFPNHQRSDWQCAEWRPIGRGDGHVSGSGRRPVGAAPQ